MTENVGPIPNYRSFWLRSWQVGNQHEAVPASWRFSLEDPESEQKRGFDDLQALVVFLESELGCVDRGPAAGADAGDLVD